MIVCQLILDFDVVAELKVSEVLLGLEGPSADGHQRPVRRVRHDVDAVDDDVEALRRFDDVHIFVPVIKF